MSALTGANFRRLADVPPKMEGVCEHRKSEHPAEDLDASGHREDAGGVCSSCEKPDRGFGKGHFRNLYLAFPLKIRHFNLMAKIIKKKRTPSAAFMKPVTPDQKLALVIGEKPLPRTELTKKLWAYIRKNGLQDKKVRTQINADENLKAVFNGKKSVSMFEMTKLVSGHVK